MWAIADRKRKRAYLFNGPQLGFAIPELFFEFELHSPGQDIRGVSAAGLPLVGIGHNGDVAWGFTSGLSDEDDLFAVAPTATRPTSSRARRCRWTAATRSSTTARRPPRLPGLIDDPGAPRRVGDRADLPHRPRPGPVPRRRRRLRAELRDLGPRARDARRAHRAQRREEHQGRRQGHAAGDLERERDGDRLTGTSATGIRACIRCARSAGTSTYPSPATARASGAACSPARHASRRQPEAELARRTGTTCPRSAGRTATPRPASGTNGDLHRARLLSARRAVRSTRPMRAAARSS